MLKYIFLFYLLFSQIAWAQDLARDMDFVETQNTLSTPWNFPIYVDLLGNVSLIRASSDAGVGLNPMGQIQGKFTKSLYIKPVESDSFGFREQVINQEWIEIKRERGEAGLGLGAELGATFNVGLVPFKGARQVMVRSKSTQNEKTSRPTLPDELDEISKWRDGDSGSFQRFGGIQIFAGASFSALNVLTVGITIQNLWGLNIIKINSRKIMLTLAEEDLTKRRIQTGTAVSNAKIHFFNGKRLTAHFIFDPENPHHRELYRYARKGRLDKVQEKLPADSQKMSWQGSERMAYLGIPGLAGKHYQRSEYVMSFEGEEEVLDIRSRRNAGVFIPLRSHNRLVYQTDASMTIFWYSEMNKADHSTLDKHFLGPGRYMGVKGFEFNIAPGTMIGATLSQIGMSFTREEIEKVDAKLLDSILVNFEQRCLEFNLACGRPKKFKQIKKKLVSFLDQRWEKYRDDLGFIMVEWPVLVHSYLKTIKSQKKIYFKFMNQKYQSLEGTAPIEI